jgi:hypothetical protein
VLSMSCCRVIFVPRWVLECIFFAQENNSHIPSPIHDLHLLDIVHTTHFAVYFLQIKTSFININVLHVRPVTFQTFLSGTLFCQHFQLLLIFLSDVNAFKAPTHTILKLNLVLISFLIISLTSIFLSQTLMPGLCSDACDVFNTDLDDAIVGAAICDDDAIFLCRVNKAIVGVPFVPPQLEQADVAPEVLR